MSLVYGECISNLSECRWRAGSVHPARLVNSRRLAVVCLLDVTWINKKNGQPSEVLTSKWRVLHHAFWAVCNRRRTIDDVVPTS